MAYVDPIPALKQQVAAELTQEFIGWNGDDLADRLGTDRRRLAEIRRGALTRFSLEQLIRYAEKLHRRAELHFVRPPAHKPSPRHT